MTLSIHISQTFAHPFYYRFFSLYIPLYNRISHIAANIIYGGSPGSEAAINALKDEFDRQFKPD